MTNSRKLRPSNARKRKLYSGRRGDPEVRSEIQVHDDVFYKGLGRISPKNYQRNKLIYEVLSNETLDCYIGTKWNERIINENGDFAYVVPRALRFWLTKRNPIVEFKLIGDNYVRSEIEEGIKSFLLFSVEMATDVDTKIWSVINIFDLVHVY